MRGVLDESEVVIREQPKGLAYSLHAYDNQAVVARLGACGTQVQLIYLDPPYNTGRLRGARKSFRDTATADWRERRLSLTRSAYSLLRDSGFVAVSINQSELFNFKSLLDEVFTPECFIGLFPVKIRHEKRQLMINATLHDLFEYLLIYRKNKKTRFFTTHKQIDPEKFIYEIRTLHRPEMKTINGKTVEIYGPNQYEILKTGYSAQALRRYVIAGKLATANWSGEWYENHIRRLGDDLLVKVEGLENDGLGYRWFQSGNTSRHSGVYFQSQLTAGRPILPTNDLDYTEVVPTIYKEGGPGCDFKDSKKPEALMRFILDICTKPGDIVLDLFGGSGTTLAVAIKTHRSAIIAENDPSAVAIIKARAENLRLGADADGQKHDFALHLL